MSLLDLRAPGVYVQEVPAGPRPIEAVGTSTAGFVGVSPGSGVAPHDIVAVTSWLEFVRRFAPDGNATSTALSDAVYGFFANGGGRCYIVAIGPDEPIAGGGTGRRGLQLFEEIDEIAIVAAPGYTDAESYDSILTHCGTMADRAGIVDARPRVENVDQLTRVQTVGVEPGPGGAADEPPEPTGEGLRPPNSDYAAFYFPWLVIRDPFGRERRECPPSGHVAGIWARSDSVGGVHKAPANEEVMTALGLTYRVTKAEQEVLNPAGVNCIRTFPERGIRVWGARTLADSASEWRYLNVRRLFNMLEESIALGTVWVVFRPNDSRLWSSLRRDITAFLTRVWRDGALLGRTPDEAFYVKCDAETNPPEVRDAGQVVTLIGVAPVKPAEFVVFQLSQSQSGTTIETVGG